MGNNGSRRLPFYIIPMPLRSLHSFCSIPSHLLKSVERQILHIREQREAFTPYYLGTEGVSPYGGNRGSWKYEHVNGKPHACMHACMQHATLTRTHGRTQHSCTHAAHNTRRNTHAHTQVLNLLPTSVKDCTFRDLHIDQGISYAQK